MPPENTRTIDIGSPEWYAFLREHGIEGAPMPTPSVQDGLPPADYVTDLPGITRPFTPEEVAVNERMETVLRDTAALLGVDVERYRATMNAMGQRVNAQELQLNMGYMWAGIQAPPPDHGAHIPAEIAAMKEAELRLAAEELGVTLEALQVAQREAQRRNDLLLSSPAAVPEPAVSPQPTTTPDSPAPARAPEAVFMSIDPSGPAARNYGAEHMPAIAAHQVGNVQQWLAEHYGVAALGRGGVDGKWGPDTQALFERACREANIDPRTVDFTDLADPELRSLVQHHTQRAQSPVASRGLPDALPDTLRPRDIGGRTDDLVYRITPEILAEQRAQTRVAENIGRAEDASIAAVASAFGVSAEQLQSLFSASNQAARDQSDPARVADAFQQLATRLGVDIETLRQTMLQHGFHAQRQGVMHGNDVGWVNEIEWRVTDEQRLAGLTPEELAGWQRIQQTMEAWRNPIPDAQDVLPEMLQLNPRASTLLHEQLAGVNLDWNTFNQQQPEGSAPESQFAQFTRERTDTLGLTNT